jgi:hypothetical protein
MKARYDSGLFRCRSMYSVMGVMPEDMDLHVVAVKDHGPARRTLVQSVRFASPTPD